ncbi:MAG: hypothetical protein WCA46_03860 [Actinocatenispora sp.]
MDGGQPGQWQYPGMTAPEPQRPTVLNAALIALVGLIVLCLVETAVGVYILGSEADNGTADNGSFTLRQAVVIDIVFNLVLAAGFVPTLLLIARGRPAGRVMAIVLSAFYLLARCGCGGFSGLIGGLYASGNPDFSRDEFSFNPNIWFVVVGMEVFAIAVTVVATSLLFSRNAREYFRLARS